MRGRPDVKIERNDRGKVFEHILEMNSSTIDVKDIKLSS
jgi:hypothetical protein